jgi:hypothetical protein
LASTLTIACRPILNPYASLLASMSKYYGFFRALSKRFPFAIYYRFQDDLVEIYAVLDCRQDPQTINSILESPRTTRLTEVADIVKLVPIARAKPDPQFGSAKGLITMSDDFEERLADFEEYMK